MGCRGDLCRPYFLDSMERQALIERAYRDPGGRDDVGGSQGGTPIRMFR